MSEFRTLVESRLRDLEARAIPLIKRKNALLVELEELQSEVNSLLPELLEVTKAAKSIGLTVKELPSEQEDQTEEEIPANKGGLTIKQSIRVVLNGAPFGMSSGDMLDKINKEQWDGRLDRTSFSPQLSRMKRDGEVELQAGVYKVTAKGLAAGGLVRPRFRLRFGSADPKNEPSDVSPSNGSEAGSAVKLFD